MSDTSAKLFSNQGITSSTRYIHTAGEFAYSNLLYVQEVGTLKSLRPHKSIREGLESFLFMIIKSGEGFVRVSGKEYSLKEGDCVFINCFEKYEHESSESNPWELSWVHFYGKSAKAFFDLFIKENENNNVFTPSETDSYVKMIENLMALCNEKNLMSEIYANETLTEMLTEIISDVTSNPENDSETDVNFIRTWINDNYASDSVIEDACEKLEVNYSKADSDFKEAFGINLEEYLKFRRFNVAKEKLRFSIETEKQIADECGIKDYNEFIKMFVEGEGMTPEIYRSKWAQWIK